ncbi:hypothetical protein [Leeuwenhoekiella marinoflava]|uniref:Outer membrane protein with beta-barrel domain n=2 Tax=Leeuwenhoekiella marinoflava TaxID=988 RepID=A0A4Q0PMN3_9FLAO|nr:hypothetical protein [Leeuwenhoekiella marinoflava]RXG31727.1 hypothetical protein DSL99_1545 [Leeuwenhoekiella marinoflava]SHF07194.1 hypothetical protein SAMN02745246_01637 [Leeuwenhoekiella marinoflava DSM 3653]
MVSQHQAQTGKGRNIANNAADYVSFKTTYQPDWFAIGSDHKEDIIAALAIAANAGMRREIWNEFTFELAAGAGLACDLKNQNEDNVFFFPDYHFRLGYRF